ncbi:hypothetical protein LLG96_11990 [bacterium]|nr:hypothetical protein [bacterium]
MNHKHFFRLVHVVLFAVAMGYFEAVVVVYLRGMYYPDGFSFPLQNAPARMIGIEFFREAATVVMLMTVAALAGRKFWERFGYFLILFGIWDIFYYVFLRVTIDWPGSLVEWDVLFLIPLPWIGPVIAPSLVAALMTVIGISMTNLVHRGYDFRPARLTWVLTFAATTVILYSFMKDFDAMFCQMMPQPYLYSLLVLGLVLYCIAYVHTYREVIRRGIQRKE